MSKATQRHLEGITPEALEAYRGMAHKEYASVINNNGSFDIGINGFGDYIVRKNGNVEYRGTSASAAVYKYRKILER